MNPLKPPKGYEEIDAPVVVMGGQGPVYNKAYRKGDLSIWVSREVHNGCQLRWHMSISAPDRNPLWEEIRDARYDLLPDDCIMGQLLPPKREYVNVHEHCFHLHEIIE